MSVFTVYAPPDVTDGSLRQAENLVFVRDKFSRTAVAFGPLWMAVTGRWVGLVAYALAFGTLILTLKLFGLWPQALGVSYLALNLIFAHEESTLHGLFLEAQGWRDVGVVEAETMEDAEERYFAAWEPSSVVAQTSADDDGATQTRLLPASLTSIAEPISSVIARVPALRQRFRPKRV